ncbi:unnamed protein product [Rhizoctonia solani]|uniref:Protein kinase domain-containing protein n=1 Tax=Rhizoctonia solani TaxID=456999 RepID=A0A8H3HS72_9AGAM|nr:unnamed protein product [Rhizoctonia solani]
MAKNALVLETGIAKIIDFGSTVMNQYSLQFTGGEDTHHYTLRWTAPECLQEGGVSISMPADVYALAMTILEIMTGKVPFGHIQRDAAVCAAIYRKEQPPRPINSISTSSRDGDKLWDLLQLCWQYNPDDRSTASDVELALSGITQDGLRAETEM